MASYDAGVVGTLTHYCDSGGSYQERYSATVTWDESYNSENVLTCSNFRYSWKHTSSTSGAIYGCYCGGTPAQCLSCYRGVTLGYKSSISDTGNAYVTCYDTNGSGVPDYDRTLASGSISGTLRISPGSSTTVKPLLFKSCSDKTVSFTIRNNRSKPTPTNPTFKPSCTASTTSYTTATFNGGLSWGTCPSGGSQSSSYEVRDNSGLVKSGSGSSVSISTLQANTRYTATFKADNGCLGATATCSTVTLAGNTLTDISAVSFDTISVRLVPIVGGGEYSLSHTIQIAECGTNNWSTAATSTATAPTIIEIGGLTEEKCYKVRAITTTTAGAYTGNELSTETPPKGICFAEFTDIDVELEGVTATAEICYKWEATIVPADITVYYRVKDGFDPAWIVGDTFTATKETGTRCFTLKDLYPNQVVYETFISTHTEQLDWNSEMSEFMTPLLPEASSDNCESLTYMTEYLCAAVKKIREGGNMKVFANPYSQQLCEPGSTAPTSLTLWSRYLRLAHAYLCVLCDLMNLSHAGEGQYLVGEIGWVSILTEIVESQMETDGWKLATSDAIYKYIQSKLKEVWHYQGTVDVMVENKDDLSNYHDATSAIVKSENAIYEKKNGSWVKSSIEPEDFGVWHIEQDSDAAKAESGWYYWQGTWNNLDADLEQLEARIEAINLPDNVTRTPDGSDLSFSVVDESFPCEQMKEGIVYFVTEPAIEPESRIVEFDVDRGLPEVADQKIAEGGKAQKPTVEPIEDECGFGGWFEEDEEPPECEEGYIPKW